MDNLGVALQLSQSCPLMTAFFVTIRMRKTVEAVEA